MATALMQSFLNDLNKDKFTLTSLPEVAMKVRKALDDEDISCDDVAQIINQDPAIAAKLMKTANSVFFRGRVACESTSSGVSRIGLENTRKLVVSFAMKDLFKSDIPLLRDAMIDAWEHSLLVGSIAHALARRTGLFAAEEAMLAGLLSQIGVLSVFNYAANYPEISSDEESLRSTVAELKQEVGAMVLDRWAFPPEYLACALQGENWTRDTGRQADLCDLVIVANWHASIGKADIPRISDVPAYHKLTGGNLPPEVAIDFLQEAKDEVSEARSMLAA